MSLPIGNTASDINAETIAGSMLFHAWLGSRNERRPELQFLQQPT